MLMERNQTKGKPMTSQGNKQARVTMDDVAAHAGVGSATVDRVLNERGNVSDEVRRKVLQAARELGLKRILPSPHHRHIQVNVILARPERPLITRMAQEFRRQSTRLDRSMTIHRTLLKYESPEAISEAMLREGFDAVIVDAPDHALIHEAMARLHAAGKPVITVISDVPEAPRLAYAGIDHAKAGRTAGYFLGHMARPGKVVVLCHHIGFQAHAERIRGLGDALTSTALTLAEVVRGGDDPILSEVLLKEAFARHPDCTAVYNAGAGNRGVVAAMKAGVLAVPPTFIGHELTPFTWDMLRQGWMSLTLDQSPELQVQQALDRLMHHFGFEPEFLPRPVPFVLYSPQNLPDERPAEL